MIEEVFGLMSIVNEVFDKRRNFWARTMKVVDQRGVYLPDRWNGLWKAEKEVPRVWRYTVLRGRLMDESPL